MGKNRFKVFDGRQGKGGSGDPDLRRIATLDDDQASQAADRELAAHPGDEDWQQAHEAARAERDASRLIRTAGAVGRFRTAEDRARLAAKRDETARARDLTARARDQAAAARDRAAAEAERVMAARGPAFQGALEHAAEVRAQASADRAQAAADRELAARDREDAARDRVQLMSELRLAHVDELTGAYRRPMGEAALQQELDRVHRGNGKLVVAYLDVDGLKEVNDRLGHGAGDVLLRSIVAAVRSRTRSYEPIVRFGGDEFVCSIADVGLEVAKRRFADIRRSLRDLGERGTFSVGLAELRRGDSLEDLIARADSALAAARAG